MKTIHLKTKRVSGIGANMINKFEEITVKLEHGLNFKSFAELIHVKGYCEKPEILNITEQNKAGNHVSVPKKDKIWQECQALIDDNWTQEREKKSDPKEELEAERKRNDMLEERMRVLEQRLEEQEKEEQEKEMKQSRTK